MFVLEDGLVLLFICLFEWSTQEPQRQARVFLIEEDLYPRGQLLSSIVLSAINSPACIHQAFRVGLAAIENKIIGFRQFYLIRRESMQSEPCL
jgi:hypothetical protein